MRFRTLFGAVAQTHSRAEGTLLIRAGLLRPVTEGELVVGVEATEALASYFGGPPELERVYPLLVEFVASCRYPELDDLGSRRALAALGMAAEGLEALRRAAAGGG